MEKEIIIRRLAISKYLYSIGKDKSYMPESMAYISILLFHDAVEILLKS